MPSKKKSTSASSASYTFTLKDIDAKSIIDEYLHPQPPSKTKRSGKISETLIRIENDSEMELAKILHEKSNRASYFVDFHKNQVKVWNIMYDEHNGAILPFYTAKNCWWDRHPFTSSPIGCPLRYSKKIDDENICSKISEFFKEHNITSEVNDIFETEGTFCSFPCVQAFILDESHSSRYKNSSSLLTLLFYKMYGEIKSVPIAPPWKQLVDYGGHLTIEEFRSTFGRVIYSELPNMKRPYMFCSSGIVRER